MNTNIDNEEGPEFERLKQAIKRIGYGEVRVIIQRGKPVRIEEAVKQVRLDGDQKDFNDGLETVRL